MSKKEEEREQSSSANTTNADGKPKRTLRFSLPDLASSESFSSAASFETDDDYEDFTHESEHKISVLKKYIRAPLRKTMPRTSSPKPCFKKTKSELSFQDEENEVFVSAASSSKQLFAILRHSPTPSDADMQLINATYSRKIEEVKQAISNGADINTYRDRQTPLLIATEIGDCRLVAYLLTVPNVNPDFQNIFGQTPLLIAVKNSYDKIVRLLLNSNAGVNITDNMGKSPLHGVLFQQRSDLAKLLLGFGANYELQDCFGERPMYTSAVKKPNIECLMVLLRVGASPEYTTITGASLLSRAIINWTEFSIIETLLSYGASANSQDLYTKKTPLHYAAIINDIRIAELLVSRGADVNIKTAYNFTPFDEAVFHKSLDVAKFLMNLTLNVNMKNFNALPCNRSSDGSKN